MKEAVVLILDANESMNQTYEHHPVDEELQPNDASSKSIRTRWECAKQVAMDIISDLMIRSKTHEAAVILLKTHKTHHHFYETCLDDDDDDQDIVAINIKKEQGNDDENQAFAEEADVPFPNLTELGGDGITTGVNRPSTDLLRQLHQRRAASTHTSQLRGDFCDGIILAADALYKRTSGKKYQRRIVLITDAEHKVVVNHQQLLVVLDSLRAMECRLEVIGLDFEQQAEYEFKLAAVKQEKDSGGLKEEDESEGENIDGDGSATDVSDEDEDQESTTSSQKEEADPAWVKRQNEQLLVSLTEKTGGFVMAAKEMQSIFQKMLGQRTPKSTRRKVQLQIAPGLVFDARFSLLLSKATAPTLTKQVAVVNEHNEVEKDALGYEVMTTYRTMHSHWNPDDENTEITETVHAYRYGSDLVPMGGYDLAGLINLSPVTIKLLGYLPLDSVLPQFRIGPPYGLSGADSRKTCAAIAALAQALHRKKQVGMATMVKTKDADPILVGLFPMEQGDRPLHLVVLQLPFAGDIPQFSLNPLELSADDNNDQRERCDDLIDKLMLPDDKFQHTQVTNSYLRSFQKTVVQRVLDPECSIVKVRTSMDDPMATPKAILEGANSVIERFRGAFPLKKLVPNASQAGKNQRRKGPATYRDFLEQNE